MTLYGDWFDGLRAFYERKEGNKSSPGFSAAMALSFLLGVNLALTLALIDFGTKQLWDLRAVVFSHKWILLVAGGVMATCHVRVAKRIGLFSRTGGARNPSWSRSFACYCAITAMAFVTMIVLGGL